MALTASRAGSFTPGDGCALDASSSSEPTCQLTFLPRAIGPVTISAAYSGDPAHAASGGGTRLNVTAQLLGPVRPTRATISALRQTNARFAVASASTPLTALAARTHPPRGTVFSFRVDQPAVVKIAIQKHVGGRQLGHRCLAPAPKLRRHRQCIRMITLATLTRGAREGSNRVSFTGRIAKRALPPGRYQARFTAIDSAGVSPPRTLRFTIVR